MAQLYDELLALYCRHDQRIRESLDGDTDREGYGEYWDENWDAGVEVEEAIIRIVDPKTVGDVMALPIDTLRKEGLVYLIERDASNRYDQVDGFIECVYLDNVEAVITPDQYRCDGYDLCEWITETIPLRLEP